MQLLQKVQTLSDAPEEKKHALRAGSENFLNLKIRVNLTYFVFWETCKYLL